ncbi:hypothetical protein [Clostridium sp.]|uniref:hypothetical protein n=1 Tax=Clostridium sp. TaxID=1506 RepID=UPI002FC5ECF3
MILKNLKVMTESIGKNVSDLANTITVTAIEQDKINKIEKEIKVLDTEIKSTYEEIGKRVVSYIEVNGHIDNLELNDIFTMLNPKILKKELLKNEVIEATKELGDKIILQEKKRASDQFEKEKEKLDRALGMDIINKEEYYDKIRMHENRLKYFDEIRTVEKQYEFKIISVDEKNEKIKEILDRE